MNIYSRLNKKHIDELVHDLRRNPLDKTNFVIKLEDDIYYKGTRARCYLNAMVFTVLDQYKIEQAVRKEFVFTHKSLKKDISKYMSHILSVLLRDDVVLEHKNVMISHVLADIKSSFGYISLICNDVVTIDHSIFNYVEEYQRNPEFRRIFHEPIFNATDDVWTIRRKVDNIVNKFKDGTFNLQPLSDFLKYGTKVKPEQLLMFFCYDLAPDPLRSNQCLAPIGVSIVNGVSTVWAIFVLDSISRLAIVSSKVEIKVTGVQSKYIGMSLQSTKINTSDTREIIHDCGSTDYLEITIESPKDLEFYWSKNYYDKDTHEKLGYIDTNRTDLIGKKLYIRSFMLCKSPIVCTECYGYNWEMVADTPLYKGNFNLFVLQEFNKKMQTVISVKHHAGWVYTDMYVTFKGENTTMDALFRRGDIFEPVGWNKFKIKGNHDVKFVPHEVIEDKKGKKRYTKEQLWIDGSQFITDQILRYNADGTITYTVPNNSVLLQAEALKVAVSKHSTKDRDTGKADFDASELKGKSLSEQAKLMFLYQRRKVKLDHFIYYEAIVHALLRDADRPNKRVSDDTTNLMMISADSILTKVDRSTNISTTLPHGYINNIFNNIHQGSEPSEYDILYNNLEDRKVLRKNIFAEFNDIINRASSISNNEDTKINQMDEGLSMSDLLYDID